MGKGSEINNMFDRYLWLVRSRLELHKLSLPTVISPFWENLFSLPVRKLQTFPIYCVVLIRDRLWANGISERIGKICRKENYEGSHIKACRQNGQSVWEEYRYIKFLIYFIFPFLGISPHKPLERARHGTKRYYFSQFKGRLLGEVWWFRVSLSTLLLRKFLQRVVTFEIVSCNRLSTNKPWREGTGK